MFRVLVVDDSKFMRTVLSSVINRSSSFRVTGEAANGEEAFDMFQNEAYDVMTLDIEMPVLNGLETLRKIQEGGIHLPTVMFSSLTTEGAAETIEALSLGAAGFLGKPQNPIELHHMEKSIEQALLEAVQMERSKTSKIKPESPSLRTYQPGSSLEGLIVLGCSTGGPKALREIIPTIPAHAPYAVVIVQHMPAGSYIRSLADGLNRRSSVTVKEARDGEPLLPGHVYLIPGGCHGELTRGGSVRLTDAAPVNGHRPSVDVLFRSAARFRTVPVVGVVLTGMGADGADGAAELRKKGCTVYAESEETAAVYGMPKKVVERGAASFVLPLSAILPAIFR